MSSKVRGAKRISISDVMKPSNRSQDRYSTLEKIGEEESVVILSLPEHSLLPPLGLREGKRVKVKTRQPFGGPLIVEIDSRRVAVSKKIAGEIKVEYEKE